MGFSLRVLRPWQQQERDAFREISVGTAGRRRNIVSRRRQRECRRQGCPPPRHPSALFSASKRQARLQVAARNGTLRTVVPGTAVAARPWLPHAAQDGGGTERGKISRLSPRLDGD